MQSVFPIPWHSLKVNTILQFSMIWPCLALPEGKGPGFLTDRQVGQTPGYWAQSRPETWVRVQTPNHRCYILYMVGVFICVLQTLHVAYPLARVDVTQVEKDRPNKMEGDLYTACD